MTDHKIDVNGVEWLLRFSRLRGKARGWCQYDKKKILVHNRLTGEERLEVVIHELLHAFFPDLAEESVTNAGEGIAKVLWQIGVRC